MQTEQVRLLGPDEQSFGRGQETRGDVVVRRDDLGPSAGSLAKGDRPVLEHDPCLVAVRGDGAHVSLAQALVEVRSLRSGLDRQ
jgi:hypothetical protein